MIFLIRISDKFYRYVYLKVKEGYRLRLESIILKKGGRGGWFSISDRSSPDRNFSMIQIFYQGFSSYQ